MKKRLVCVMLALIVVVCLFTPTFRTSAAAFMFCDSNYDFVVGTSDARNVLMYSVSDSGLPNDITPIDVDGSGNITTVDARLILQYGLASISAFPCEEGITASEDIVASCNSFLLTLGQTAALEATVYPRTATYNEIAYFSSDTSVVTVSGTGLMTAVGYGTATVDFYSGRASSSCSVTVSGGSIALSGFTALPYDNVAKDSVSSLNGTITSPYPLRSARCEIVGTDMSKSYTFSSAATAKTLNMNTYFTPYINLSSSAEGTYTFNVYATDTCNVSEVLVYSKTYSIYQTVAVGSQRQVMWSDNLIDTSRTTATLTLNSPEFDSDPVMVLDNAWEGDGSDYYSLVEDVDGSGITFYRLYYNGWNMTDVQIHICYAYSYDGINWTKPNLGLYNFNGSTANNIILGPTTTEAFDNFFVFKDTNPNCKNSERYKAVAESYVSTALSLYSWVSSDGIHWTKSRCITTDGTFDSVNTAFWDSVNQCYYCYYRYFDSTVGRAIKMVTSTDFRNWTASVPLTYSDDNAFQMYTNNIMKYYRAPQVFIGFPTRYNQRPEWTENYNNLCSYQIRLAAYQKASRYGLAITDTLFMVSYDGSYWERYEEAWVTPGPEHEGGWVYGDCYFCYGMIETSNGHDTDNELSMYCFEGKWTGAASYLYRYTIRIDGFACYKATYATQTLVTNPFTFTGDTFLMNFATSAAGSIYVRILDEHGNYLGYTTSEIFGDKVDREVSFANCNLSSLEGQTIRLEFVMSDAELYSFKFE